MTSDLMNALAFTGGFYSLMGMLLLWLVLGSRKVFLDGIGEEDKLWYRRLSFRILFYGLVFLSVGIAGVGLFRLGLVVVHIW